MSVRLTDDEAWNFLTVRHTAVLTTLRADGWPVSLPVWFAVLRPRIYVRTPSAAKKVTRIRRDSRACLVVHAGEQWSSLAGVMTPAHAAVLSAGTEADTAAAALDEKYAAFSPLLPHLPRATRDHYTGIVIIRLEPAGPFVSWDNARLLPGVSASPDPSSTSSPDRVSSSSEELPGTPAQCPPPHSP